MDDGSKEQTAQQTKHWALDTRILPLRSSAIIFRTGGSNYSATKSSMSTFSTAAMRFRAAALPGLAPLSDAEY